MRSPCIFFNEVKKLPRDFWLEVDWNVFDLKININYLLLFRFLYEDYGKCRPWSNRRTNFTDVTWSMQAVFLAIHHTALHLSSPWTRRIWRFWLWMGGRRPPRSWRCPRWRASWDTYLAAPNSRPEHPQWDEDWGPWFLHEVLFNITQKKFIKRYVALF